MAKASAYGDKIWQVDSLISIIRRKSDIHFTQIALEVLERRGHIPHICFPHIPRIPPPPKEDPRGLPTTEE
jgi:hypothetical protein